MTLQRKAVITASVTAFVLTIFKFIVALMTGSVVVLASAIDSILDMAISIFNVYAVKTSEMEEDNVYNYGRGKIEGLASVIEGAIITLSGLFIIYQGISNIISGKEISGFDLALGVMVISTAATWFLVVFLNKIAKKTNSLVIKSDALHYKTDLYTNLGIIFSLIFIYFSGLHFIDGVVSIIIAIYIIKEAVGIIKEGVEMLLDKALDEETTEKIEQILKEAKITSYHFLKTRKSGNMNFVDVHLVFNTGILLLNAHDESDDIERRIIKIDENAKWVVTTHLDPFDDSRSHDNPKLNQG